MFETPILFIIFNRPDTTKEAFNRIKQIQPKYLFVAADGARKDKEGETELCNQTRDVIKDINWQCELKTLFRDENRGCGRAVSEAISWFFENVGQGIILEDDCLPDISFFSYCENLLEYYKNEPRVMHIGATNSQFGIKRSKYSYYYSKYPHIWGWATWKRAWDKYQYSFPADNQLYLENTFKKYNLSRQEIEYWKHHWELVNSDNRIDTWDIQWTFTCWFNNGVTIVPNKNLISNIGFNESATHTKSVESKLANLTTERIGHIIHPVSIKINKEADDYTFTNYNLLKSESRYKIRDWISEKIPVLVKTTIKKLIR